MIILAIETSCDDTSIALIQTPAPSGRGSFNFIERREKERVSFNILSNVISSQTEIHKKWGGVYPALAKREHQRNLIPVLEKALKKARELKMENFTLRNAQGDTERNRSVKLQIEEKQLRILRKILKREPELLDNFLNFIPKIKNPKIEAIALTVGPGLEPCLWAGVNFAKALAYFWQIPIIPVNHIEAHIFANFIDKFETPAFAKDSAGKQNLKIKTLFPAVCLVVSGGHTQLILMKDIGNYKILGETQDDAAGECLDKVARILGLEYPGGPVIEDKSSEFKIKNMESKIKLPRPMIHSKDYNFSFSGLKTAVLYDFRKRSLKVRKNKDYILQICAEAQQSVIDVLIRKTVRVLKNYRIKSVILGGGVIANNELRKQFREKIKKEFPTVKLYIPDPKFCTDNAAMVAVVSFFHRKEKKDWKKIKARADLRISK